MNRSGRLFSRFIRGLLLTLLITLSVYAEEPNISITYSNTTPKIGDKITVEIKAVTKGTPDVSFELNIKDDGTFNVTKPIQSQEKLPDNYNMALLTFDIYPFSLEEIEPGSVLVTAGESQVEKGLPAIKVTSVLQQGQEKQDINKLKPQSDIKPDYSHIIRYIIYGLAVLVALAVLFFITRKLIRKYRNRDSQEKEQTIPDLPPCEEVKELMAKLLSRKLLKDGRVKEFYVELTDIAKRFLGRVYSFDYLSATTEDVLYHLKGKLQVKEESIIVDFLESSDFVKFAKYIPEQGEINKNVNSVYQFSEMICSRLIALAEPAKTKGEEHVQI